MAPDFADRGALDLEAPEPGPAEPGAEDEAGRGHLQDRRQITRRGTQDPPAHHALREEDAVDLAVVQDRVGDPVRHLERGDALAAASGSR